MKVALKKIFRRIRLPMVSFIRRRDSYDASDEDFVGYESFSLHSLNDTAACSKNDCPTTLQKHLKGM